AAGGQPDRVAPLAGGDVEGPPRRQVGQLLDHEPVGLGGPDQLLGGVPGVPFGAVHATTLGTWRARRRTAGRGPARPGSAGGPGARATGDNGPLPGVTGR